MGLRAVVGRLKQGLQPPATPSPTSIPVPSSPSNQSRSFSTFRFSQIYIRKLVNSKTLSALQMNPDSIYFILDHVLSFKKQHQRSMLYYEYIVVSFRGGTRGVLGVVLGVVLRDDLKRKKTFKFGHCPNYPPSPQFGQLYHLFPPSRPFTRFLLK